MSQQPSQPAYRSKLIASYVPEHSFFCVLYEKSWREEPGNEASQTVGRALTDGTMWISMASSEP